MIKMNLRQVLGFSVLIGLGLSSAGYAENNNFKCPLPSEIQLENLTTPSIWAAPPVAGSKTDEVGLGLGGNVVGKFLAAAPFPNNPEAEDNKDWICIYETTGDSLHAYENKIKALAESVAKTYPFNNKRYLARLNKEFQAIENSRQPYLKQYANQSVGFVHYHGVDTDENYERIDATTSANSKKQQSLLTTAKRN